jgi:hypothetical protein
MSVASTFAAPYRERRKGTSSTPICPFAPVTSTRGGLVDVTVDAKRRDKRETLDFTAISKVEEDVQRKYTGRIYLN